MSLLLWIGFTLSGLWLLGFSVYARWPLLRAAYKDKAGFSPVSIIISARNEAANLERHLPVFLRGLPEGSEILVIDDRSTDRTAELLQDMQEKYPGRIRVVRVQPQEWASFRGNKKFALTMGIKAATHDRLLFTDADCVPASDRWVPLMSGGLEGDKMFVLGYGKYRKYPGWLNLLIRFETLETGARYLGFALRGNPYMGVGRNLAYRKSFFMGNNGFGPHFSLLSGDDDLLVNRLATARNTTVCFRPEAHSVSEPKRSWKAWFVQKRRHLSTARHYRWRHKVPLFVQGVSLAAFWSGTLWLAVSQPQAWFLWLIIALRVGEQIYVTRRISLRLADPVPVLAVVPAEIHLLLMQILIFVSNLIKKPEHWQ